jgi:alkylation response protein AidB-like acyl-CoA dehydrogenase
MTITEPHRLIRTNPITAVRDWLAKNWDPDLTVAQWWQLLGSSGWAAPVLPAEAFGLGLSRADSVAVMREIGAFGALGPPSGLGLLLAAPTIATHGTPEQIETYIRDIVTGRQAWCQLFSEPGAGSDLAGLTTRAERDGDEWIVNGQKVWTSLGHTADMGMLIARTNVDAPKHQGISWMAIDMHQPGVEIRPLLEMTGHAMFNEVFLTDARVPVGGVVGDVNNGWAATNTTLQAERAGLGAGGSGGAAGAQPGTIAGQLERRAGDLVPAKSTSGTKKSGKKRTDRRAVNRLNQTLLIDFARNAGRIDDPIVRQELMRLHSLNVVGGLNAQRLKGMRNAGKDIPGMANISKLMMSDVVRLSRDLGLSILGIAGTLHAYTSEQRDSLNAATGNPLLGIVTGQALYAQAPPIYGGTDQIQKNIIGERVLGLPKEPNNDKVLPFSELPKNV